MKKALKPLSIIIVILIVISVFIYGAGSVMDMAGGGKNTADTAFVVGKTKISATAISSQAQNMYEQIEQQLNQKSGSSITLSPDVTTSMVVNQQVGQVLILQYAKKNHIRATGRDINQLLSQYEKQYTKKGLLQALQTNGMTLSQFKQQLSEQIIYQNVEKAMAGNFVPSEADINIFYMQSAQAQFNGQGLDQVKGQVISALQQYYAPGILAGYISSEISGGLTVKAISPQFGPYLTQVALSAGNYTMSSSDFNSSFLSALPYTGGNIGLAANTVVSGFKQEVALITLAKSSGIQLPSNLSLQYTMTAAQNGLLYAYVTKMNPSDSQLQAYFNANHAKYDTPAQSFVNAIFIPQVKNSSGSAMTQAQNIQKDINSGKISFADAMKKFSKGPQTMLGPISNQSPMIPNVGAIPVLAQAALTLPVNQLTIASDANFVYIIQGVKQNGFQAATYSNVQAQVKSDFELQAAQAQLKSALSGVQIPQVMVSNALTQAMLQGKSGLPSYTSGSSMTSGSSTSN